MAAFYTELFLKEIIIFQSSKIVNILSKIDFSFLKTLHQMNVTTSKELDRTTLMFQNFIQNHELAKAESEAKFDSMMLGKK